MLLWACRGELLWRVRRGQGAPSALQGDESFRGDSRESRRWDARWGQTASAMVFWRSWPRTSTGTSKPSRPCKRRKTGPGCTREEMRVRISPLHLEHKEQSLAVIFREIRAAVEDVHELCDLDGRVPDSERETGAKRTLTLPPAR